MTTAGEKKITVSGTNFHLGISTLNVQAVRLDGSIIDVCIYESQTLSFEELYARHGRKAVSYLRKTYAITTVEKPSSVTRRAA